MRPADRSESYPVTASHVALRSSRVVDVRTDTVVMPDGGTATRDVVVHPGAVGIIALDDRDRVLLVQQYRHAVRHLLWEPPAGLLDEVGEDPLAAAQRELYEEAHQQAARWDVLLDAFTSPGLTDEAVRVYLARDVRDAERPRHDGVDEERDMPVAWFDLEEAVAAALCGDMHNPMAIMGVLAAHYGRQHNWDTLRPADAPWPQMSDWPGSRAANG